MRRTPVEARETGGQIEKEEILHASDMPLCLHRTQFVREASKLNQDIKVFVCIFSSPPNKTFTLGSVQKTATHFAIEICYL